MQQRRTLRRHIESKREQIVPELEAIDEWPRVEIVDSAEADNTRQPRTSKRAFRSTGSSPADRMLPLISSIGLRRAPSTPDPPQQPHRHRRHQQSVRPAPAWGHTTTSRPGSTRSRSRGALRSPRPSHRRTRSRVRRSTSCAEAAQTCGTRRRLPAVLAHATPPRCGPGQPPTRSAGPPADRIRARGRPRRSHRHRRGQARPPRSRRGRRHAMRCRPSRMTPRPVPSRSARLNPVTGTSPASVAAERTALMAMSTDEGRPTIRNSPAESLPGRVAGGASTWISNTRTNVVRLPCICRLTSSARTPIAIRSGLSRMRRRL